MPDPAALERGRRPAVQDAVEIDPAAGRTPRVKSLGYALGAQHRHRTRLHMLVEGAADGFGVRFPRQVEMRDLRQRVDPGIGAAGAVDGDALAAEALGGGFQDFLHGKPVLLALPADQAGAVIFERQLVAGHGRIVPGGMAKPRRNASASSAARPARCNRSSLSAPWPQDMASFPSSTVPGGDGFGAAAVSAASTRMRSSR